MFKVFFFGKVAAFDTRLVFYFYMFLLADSGFALCIMAAILRIWL